MRCFGECLFIRSLIIPPLPFRANSRSSRRLADCLAEADVVGCSGLRAARFRLRLFARMATEGFRRARLLEPSGKLSVMKRERSLRTEPSI